MARKAEKITTKMTNLARMYTTYARSTILLKRHRLTHVIFLASLAQIQSMLNSKSNHSLVDKTGTNPPMAMHTSNMTLADRHASDSKRVGKGKFQHRT